MGDCHELGQGRPTKQCMIGALKVHYLKLDWLSVEMIFVPEEDIYLSLADW